MATNLEMAWDEEMELAMQLGAQGQTQAAALASRTWTALSDRQVRWFWQMGKSRQKNIVDESQPLLPPTRRTT